MERCKRCLDREHLECTGLKGLEWCECPCHTGEVQDPLGNFIADVGASLPGSVGPVVDDHEDPTT